MTTIDVGQEFYPRLTNRNEEQGDGQHTAIEFRERYLKPLESREAWADLKPFITLDFRSVERLGPSFANEAFAFFTQYDVTPEAILKVILFKHLSLVKTATLERELKRGYSRK